MAAILAGCAGTPQQSSTPAPTANTAARSTAQTADSPAPTSKVIQAADFATKARQEGYQSEVRDGVVYYCWTDDTLGSRIPTRKCLNEQGLRMRMQALARQQAQMQRAGAAPNCTSAAAC